MPASMTRARAMSMESQRTPLHPKPSAADRRRMRRRLTALAAAIVMTLTACGGGGGDDEPSSGSDLDGAIPGFGGAVTRANDVGDAADQRLDDIQSQLQP